MISETKLNSSFPDTQFQMKSYLKPCRLDRNSKGQDLILYVREDISSELRNSSCIDHNKEYFFIELNLRKLKWLIICNYNPDKTRMKGYLEYIIEEIDLHSLKYVNFHQIVNLNSDHTGEARKSFCQICNFKNLLDKPTCYKNLTNQSLVV